MTARASRSRIAYAAAHLVLRAEYADVDHSTANPGAHDAIESFVDWDATLRIRRRLDALGFGLAEAMDTAQRFEIGWYGAERLIRRAGELGLSQPFIAGAGTDHLEEVRTAGELIDGVVHQARFVQEHGGEPILLSHPWLVASGAKEDDYVDVYRAIVDQLDGPLWIHWLGAMFLPSLKGYFPGRSFERVMALDPAKVRGAKLSLLDADFERRTRRALAANDQVVFTGDDWHFADLILGDGERGRATAFRARPGREEQTLDVGEFSHALLGVFDAVALPASRALDALAAGDRGTYVSLMRPCEDLGRALFEAPTMFYKSGIAFLSWLDGKQENRMLVNHLERERDREHYLRCATLASIAGVFEDPHAALQRLATF